MAHVNPHTREVSANIVYYGPSGAGKTASLEFIHRKLRADLRGKLTRVPAQLDPTASYEMIPVELGEIKGMRTRFQIASVPGDPIHTPTRKALLRDVDGIVFVADSRGDHLESNLESLKDLEENLAAYGRHLADVPIIFQWNRSDQPGALTPEALGRKLNPSGADTFESVATDGSGVLQALTTITKLVLRNLRSVSQAPPPVAGLAESAHGEQFDPRSISQESDLGLGALQESLVEIPSSTIVIEETTGDSFAEDLLDAGAEPIGDEDLPEASLADLASDLLEESGAPTGGEMTIESVTDLETVMELDAMTDLETGVDVEVEDLGPLDIPMEPFEETAALGAGPGPDPLESAFEPFDFAGEVTREAGRDMDLAEGEPEGLAEEAPAAAPAPPAGSWEIVGVGTPARLGPATFTIPLEISDEGGESRVAEITITLSPPKPARKDP